MCLLVVCSVFFSRKIKIMFYCYCSFSVHKKMSCKISVSKMKKMNQLLWLDSLNERHGNWYDSTINVCMRYMHNKNKQSVSEVICNVTCYLTLSPFLYNMSFVVVVVAPDGRLLFMNTYIHFLLLVFFLLKSHLCFFWCYHYGYCTVSDSIMYCNEAMQYLAYQCDVW